MRVDRPYRTFAVPSKNFCPIILCVKLRLKKIADSYSIIGIKKFRLPFPEHN